MLLSKDYMSSSSSSDSPWFAGASAPSTCSDSIFITIEYLNDLAFTGWKIILLGLMKGGIWDHGFRKIWRKMEIYGEEVNGVVLFGS